MTRIKILTSLSTLLFLSFITLGKPTVNPTNDSLMNWEIENTQISIDTTFILRTPVEVDGKTFNYVRKHKVSKGYYEWGNVDSLEMVEYGNVNSKNQADGFWMYKIRDDWTPISGFAKRGCKIKTWGYNCAYICKIKYRWNLIRSKTRVAKRIILHD